MAETTDSMDGLEGVTVPVTSILSMMECSICMEVVKIPFKQCKTGHLTCSACMEKLRRLHCPICKEVQFQENPICVKNILESLPRTCKNFENGCKAVVKLGNGHEEFCKFRNVACKFVRCQERIPLYNLAEHHVKNHKFYSRHMEIPHFPFEGKIQCNGWHLPQPNYKNDVHVFAYDHVILLLERARREKMLEMALYVYPVGKAPEADYFIDLVLRKNDLKMALTFKANQENASDESHCTIKLHIATLALFADAKEQIEIEFKIFEILVCE